MHGTVVVSIPSFWIFFFCPTFLSFSLPVPFSEAYLQPRQLFRRFRVISCCNNNAMLSFILQNLRILVIATVQERQSCTGLLVTYSSFIRGSRDPSGCRTLRDPSFCPPSVRVFARIHPSITSRLCLDEFWGTYYYQSTYEYGYITWGTYCYQSTYEYGYYAYYAYYSSSTLVLQSSLASTRSSIIWYSRGRIICTVREYDA